jgi:isocitrate lyase
MQAWKRRSDYLLTKMIEAGACAIQIENQVSDAKQCGHQDGKLLCRMKILSLKLMLLDTLRISR